jgi:hypothetical protein
MDEDRQKKLKLIRQSEEADPANYSKYIKVT